MTDRKTLILFLVILLSAGAAAFSYVRLDRARDRALGAERDLNAVRNDLAAVVGSSGAVTVTAGSLDNSEADRRVRQAAATAGLSDKLQARLTDTMDPKRLGNSDYSEKPVILRFESVTVQQVLTFLHTLAINDPGCRATGIELTPADGAAALASGSGGEVWTADLTVAYLLYSPKDAKAR